MPGVVGRYESTRQNLYLAADVAIIAYRLAARASLFLLWYIIKMMFNRILTTVLLTAAIALLFLLQSTNPGSSSPIVILVVFVLFYIILFVVLVWVLRITSWLISRLARPVVVKKPLYQLSKSHAAYLASILAIAPIMLMAMGSVGHISIYELCLVGLFVVLGTFYVERRIM